MMYECVLAGRRRGAARIADVVVITPLSDLI
jgi:hypothetical protein